MKLEVTSSAIRSAATIDRRFTADGDDVSPPLAWSGAPPQAQSFAVIVDDPDAPRKTWVHWVVFNLPGDANSLAQGQPKRETLETGAQQGKNDFGKLGYNGPSPPPGKPHRYYFHVYALDRSLDLAPGATKDQLVAAMRGHVLAEGELMATYGR